MVTPRGLTESGSRLARASPGSTTVVARLALGGRIDEQEQDRCPRRQDNALLCSVSRALRRRCHTGPAVGRWYPLRVAHAHVSVAHGRATQRPTEQEHSLHIAARRWHPWTRGCVKVTG
jgi:hypothetical protein